MLHENKYMLNRSRKYSFQFYCFDVIDFLFFDSQIQFCFFFFSLSVSLENIILGAKCRVLNEPLNGRCLIKEDCLAYMNLYTTSLTIDKINFMRELQCDNHLYSDETIVCCPIDSSEYR